MKKKLLFITIGLLCLAATSMVLTDVSSSGTNEVMSIFPGSPPKIDGVVADEEWDDAADVELEHGVMLLQNDAANLYLLLDVTEDTIDDPPLEESPWGDFFWLSFDVNIDGAITPQVDVNYGLYPGTHDLGKSFYLDPGAWTRLYDTYSQLGAGFGSSMNSETPHRIWEFAISLPEIDAIPSDLVRIGLKTYSQTPSFTEDHPQDFATDFSDLIEVTLVTSRIDLLVLTHEDFCDAVKPLKEHKDYTGISTYVQSWQSLDKSFGGEGRDEPERIKKSIMVYEQRCDIHWVMLVGDCDRFPVRYTMTDRGTAEAFDRAFYSCDLYYADLYKVGGSFDDWDSNGNGYFGELHGETISGVLNVDHVDLNPDIAVGRVPASTTAEVTTYVNKVITYEFAAYKADWHKNALLTATTDWISDACQKKEDIANDYLTDFNIWRLYSPDNPCVSTPDLNSANINARLNEGVGFANYLGHGNRDGWAIPGGYTSADMTGLTNSNMLPVVFAGACGTAGFTTEPPYQPYTDIHGSHHAGTNDGEVFTSVPPQPAAIQDVDNPGCFAEDFLVEHDTGAIGYIGCVTGAQPFSTDLDKYFFESYTYGWNTLGGMWNYMVRRYYQEHPPPEVIDPPDWTKVAEFHQPWKFHLFGDPSLRIDGVSTIQKKDFLGIYNMNHDGWKGTLELWAVPDAYIESMPNIEGIYTSSSTEEEHDVYGYVRTWTYPLPTEWGPDYKIMFYIDFSDTPQTGDDQKFEGYLFTQTRDAIAGITWWHDRPFGFYAIRIQYYQTTFNVFFGEKIYTIPLLSNSTIENFNFSETLKQISFQVTGPTGTTGLCNATIPESLLWGTFSIYKDGAPMMKDVDYTQTHNGTHHIFSIIYTHSTHVIEIRSTEVIPEFPSSVTLPLLVLITLVAATLAKKSKSQQKPPSLFRACCSRARE